VLLSGTAANGVTGPTVLSPTILEVLWKCMSVFSFHNLVYMCNLVRVSAHEFGLRRGLSSKRS